MKVEIVWWALSGSPCRSLLGSLPDVQASRRPQISWELGAKATGSRSPKKLQNTVLARPGHGKEERRITPVTYVDYKLLWHENTVWLVDTDVAHSCTLESYLTAFLGASVPRRRAARGKRGGQSDSSSLSDFSLGRYSIISVKMLQRCEKKLHWWHGSPQVLWTKFCISCIMRHIMTH